MAITYATWNPADKGPRIGTSGGDLTAYKTATVPWNAIRATQGKSSGKWYFEVTLGAGALDDVVLGFGTIDSYLGDAAAIHGLPGFDTSPDYSWGWFAGDGKQRYYNRVTGALIFTAVGSDIIRLKVDLDSGYAYIAKNGGAFSATTLNNTSMAGLDIYPMAGLYTQNHYCIANFGASSFTYSVPDGYNSGWYEGEEPAGNRRRKVIQTRQLGN
jgi:hypothetical protein